MCETPAGGSQRISFIQFNTSAGRNVHGGSSTLDCVTDNAPTGWQIAGLHGRANDEIDRLGVFYTSR